MFISSAQVVTHQHSGDPAITSSINNGTSEPVVTHQHSGDPAIRGFTSADAMQRVVTHQHSGDPAILTAHDIIEFKLSRNSPTFW